MSPTVRRAGVADAHAIASVHIASSDDAYAPLAGSWPVADPLERTRRWAASLGAGDPRMPVFVADDEAEGVVGFAVGGPARRPELGAEQEVHAIHVLPTHRGRGLGDALWTAVCNEIRGPALISMYVYTLAELACCSFYEGHGGQLCERVPTDFHGAERTQVTYRWLSGVPSERRSAP